MPHLRSYLAGFFSPELHRRLWSWRKSRVTFQSGTFFLFYLFYPHLVMIAGMVFVGLAGLVGWLFGFRWDDSKLEPLICLMLLVFGCFFAAVAYPTMLGRTRLIFNQATGAVSEVFGLKLFFLPLLPLKRKKYPFVDFHAVVLEADGIAWRIYVERVPEDKKLKLRCISQGEARAWGEEIARRMALPLQDRSIQPVLERPPDRLDESLRTRVLRTGERVEAPVAPPACAGAYSLGADRVSVDFRRPPFKGGWMLQAILLCALAAALTAPYRPAYPLEPVYHPPAEATPEDPGPPSLWPWRMKAAAYFLLHGVFLLGGATGALLAAGLVVKVARRPRFFRIEAGPDGLRVMHRVLIFSRRRNVTQEELEELRVEERRAKKAWRVVAVSDRRFVRFPDELGMQEALYLRALLVQALTRRPP